MGLNRSAVYYKTSESNDSELANLIYEIWLRAPVYGYRKITAELHRQGFSINHKKVFRIMQEMNIKALYSKPNLSRQNIQNRKFPYLLKDIKIIYPNQVWATDLTYIKLSGGFVYLIAIIDWFSRFIIDWQISNTMDVELCLNSLNRALKVNRPLIFNTDQGSQFTSELWLNRLEQENIKISMDGKGRWADNIVIERFWKTLKYEGAFLHELDTIKKTNKIVGEFINWYNSERVHQSLNYKTPKEVYFEGRLN